MFIMLTIFKADLSYVSIKLKFSAPLTLNLYSSYEGTHVYVNSVHTVLNLLIGLKIHKRNFLKN